MPLVRCMVCMVCMVCILCAVCVVCILRMVCIVCIVHHVLYRVVGLSEVHSLWVRPCTARVGCARSTSGAASAAVARECWILLPTQDRASTVAAADPGSILWFCPASKCKD
jgi:hypothetical protein